MPFYNYQRSGIIGSAYPEDYYNAGIKSLHDYSSPDIIKDNLQLYVDAANLNSYPGSGTSWTDLSGNGRTGTLTNGPTFSSGDGGYIQCDGANDLINFGQNFNFTTAAFTIGFWINVLSLDATGGINPNLFWKGEFQISGYYAELSALSSSIIFYTNQSGAQQNSVGPAPAQGGLELQKWNHVMIVRNGTSVIIYVNGVNATSTSGSHTNPATASTNNFQLSRYAGSTNYSNIRWGAFYIWQAALSAAQVNQMFNAGRKRFGV